MKLSLILAFSIMFFSVSYSQEYIYPNKLISDQGLIEYRRYTAEEAKAYDSGNSTNPWIITDWGPERRLTSQDYVYRSDVLTIGDSIGCAYEANLGQSIFFIESNDGGQNWNPYITLKDSTRNLAYSCPAILTSDSGLFLGAMTQMINDFHENPAYFMSTNGGRTWGSINLVFPGYYLNLAEYASFSNVGERVYCSYVNLDADSIYVVASNNLGRNWNLMGQNVAYLASTPQQMHVVSNLNFVHLVWVNETNPISIHYSRSIDQGLTWTPEIDISQDSLGAQLPYLAVQDSHVVVCWMGYKNGYEWFTGDYFIKQSFDNGATWDSARALTDLHYVRRGALHLADSLLIAVWQDQRYADTLSNSEVFCRISTDFGFNWSAEERVSYGYGDSYVPVATSIGNIIHILWGDNRTEAPGLYYRANDLTTQIGDEKSALPDSMELSCYPNPFNSSVLISYVAEQGNCGSISIYSIQGQLIKQFTIYGKEGHIVWDARDQRSEPLASGIYFVRVSTSKHDITRKILYLK